MWIEINTIVPKQNLKARLVTRNHEGIHCNESTWYPDLSRMFLSSHACGTSFQLPRSTVGGCDCKWLILC
jgi:hypothetical protein